MNTATTNAAPVPWQNKPTQPGAFLFMILVGAVVLVILIWRKR